MYETLTYLVGVHAQVTAAAAALLERTLNALVDELVDETQRCFRQIKRFGMGGMLRVRAPPLHCDVISEHPRAIIFVRTRRRSRSSSCTRLCPAT